MLETNERPGGVPDDNITSLPLSSSETDSAERDDDFRISSLVHFRENLLKILVAVAFSLLIICIIILALLLHERKSGSKHVGQTDKDTTALDSALDTTVLDSDEARRIGLPEFLLKVQKAYHEYNREKIIRDPVDVKERHFPFNCTPEYLKEKTDVAFSLLNEVKNKDMDENKMKPREVKGVEQVKHFLRTVFATPYDENFYNGDWLLGPNYFCWQPVCHIGYSLLRYAIFARPGNVTELEEVLRRIKLYRESLRQYKLNMKLGVKAGMVRSEFACRSGLDAFEIQFKQTSKQNNPKDILKEWFVENYLKPSFIRNIQKADQESWFKSKRKNISTSIRDALIEGVGKPIVDLINYMEKEHLRHCLPEDLSSGLASLPVDYIYLDGKRTTQRTTKTLPLTGQALSGKNSYKNMLFYFTTSDITPEEINKLGEKRLKELYSQAIEIAKKVTGESDDDTAIREFKKELNASEQFFNSEPFPANESNTAAHKNCSDIEGAKKYCPKRWAAMEKWSAYSQQAMIMFAPKLLPLFYHVGIKKTMPNCPIEMSSNFNPSSAALSFMQAGSLCLRPAYYKHPFFLNNYGPKFADFSITAHEGWPGHHTQVQGKAEFMHDKGGGLLEWLDIETFYLIFAEGWAFYAENPVIAEDTDIYQDDIMQKYGMLQWQIWRALRLIIDTGFHYRGMNRTTALGLFSKYAWDDSDRAQKEVTRYQGAPGQATAYMLGQQKLMQLREYCKNKLGDKFNIREFHYQVLSQGSAPESYLDKHVKKYVKCIQGELKGENCNIILNPQKQEPGSDSEPRMDVDLSLQPSRQHYV